MTPPLQLLRFVIARIAIYKCYAARCSRSSMSQLGVYWCPRPESKRLDEWVPHVRIFFYSPLDSANLMRRMQHLQDGMTAELNGPNITVVRRRYLERMIPELQECIAYVPQERFRIAEAIRIAEERRLQAIDERLAFSMGSHPRLCANSPFRVMPHQEMHEIAMQHWGDPPPPPPTQPPPYRSHYMS